MPLCRQMYFGACVSPRPQRPNEWKTSHSPAGIRQSICCHPAFLNTGASARISIDPSGLRTTSFMRATRTGSRAPGTYRSTLHAVLSSDFFIAAERFTTTDTGLAATDRVSSLSLARIICGRDELATLSYPEPASGVILSHQSSSTGL